MSTEKGKPTTPDKTLGDVIREALERATAAREGPGNDEEKCTCMGCSGNPVVVKQFTGRTVTVMSREGTTTEGESEIEVVLARPDYDTIRFAVRGDEEVAELKDALQEVFL